MKEVKKFKSIRGTVVKNSNKNSVTVLVSRLKTNATYHKKYKISKKFIADCKNIINIGKEVRITETRPISKTKRYRILED